MPEKDRRPPPTPLSNFPAFEVGKAEEREAGVIALASDSFDSLLPHRILFGAYNPFVLTSTSGPPPKAPQWRLIPDLLLKQHGRWQISCAYLPPAPLHRLPVGQLGTATACRRA